MVVKSVDEIDQAFLRRFDMVFELPAPPKKLRENIVRSYCADFLDEKTVNTLADAEGLTPQCLIHKVKYQLHLLKPFRVSLFYRTKYA